MMSKENQYRFIKLSSILFVVLCINIAAWFTPDVVWVKISLVGSMSVGIGIALYFLCDIFKCIGEIEQMEQYDKELAGLQLKFIDLVQKYGEGEHKEDCRENSED